MAQISKACCTLPPAQAGPYEPKGKYVQAGGLKTYVVGPASSAKAIFILYDIFGFSPQILQGADIVASAGYTVFMPDFFVGRYAEAKWFGPNLSEKEEQEKGAFFGYISDFPKYLGQLQSALTDLKKEYSSVKQFGGFGCAFDHILSSYADLCRLLGRKDGRCYQWRRQSLDCRRANESFHA